MYLTNASIQEVLFPQMRPEKNVQVELEDDEKLIALLS
jgi:hypothetical protein